MTEIDRETINRQLDEMQSVEWYEWDRDREYAITVQLRNGPDMVAEVMYDHDMYYYESYSQVGNDTHRVVFIPFGDMDALMMTAKETQAEYDDETIGEVF